MHIIRTPRRKWIAIGAIVLICLIGLLTSLELTNTTHIFHEQASKTASQTTKGEVSPDTSVTSTDTSNGTTTNSNGTVTTLPATGSQTGDKDHGPTEVPLGSTTLTKPSGSFVSNYQPNLSGSPRPNLMQSICNTTPGATCRISFTKDGVTKSLEDMTVDAGGAAYWTWKLQDIGLTSGDWAITATATLKGQTASSTDSLKLEVQP